MLLERNQAVVGAIFAILLVGGTIFAVGFSGQLTESGTLITVELANSEGLEAGGNVLVAGLRAGKVQSVSIEGDHVAVRARLTTEMPVDSSARLVLRNFVGKRGLEIVPGNNWDRLLQEVDDPRIPVSRTDTLVDFPDLGNETVQLLRDTDTNALEKVVTALADVTAGQRDEVGRLLDGLRRVSDVLADRRDALATLIDRAEVLADAAADKDRDITRIIDQFGSTLDTLAANRDDLRRLLEQTALSTEATADLIDSERDRLDRVLNEVHEVLEIADDHQVDLAHSFAYGGVAFEGFASVGRQGNEDTPFWGNILTSGIGDAGIDAFAGCGGTVDQFLDVIFGEAECPDADERTNDPGSGSGGGISPPPPPGSSIGRLFRLHPAQPAPAEAGAGR